MGVIQREIEKAGITTVSISLVKEFTQKVRPPRALWVPFPFGRPLGAPGNVSIQRKVLRTTLALAARDDGPILEELPLEAHEEKLDAKYQALGRKCGPKGCNLDEMLGEEPGAAGADPVETPYGGNLRAVLDEIYGMALAHRKYREKRNGRTAVGASGRSPYDMEDVARTIDDFIHGRPITAPPKARNAAAPAPSESLLVRLSIDDLKAYYMEARVETVASSDLADASLTNDWFWLETWAGRMIIAARDRFVEVTDRSKDPNWIVARAIVPRGYGKSSYTLGHVVRDAAPKEGD